MAGTRLLIIQSFIIPLLLYVVIVCFGYGFFSVLPAATSSPSQQHHPQQQQQHQPQHPPPISSLVWKRMTDKLWIKVALPIIIRLPIHQHVVTRMMQHNYGISNTTTSLQHQLHLHLSKLQLQLRSHSFRPPPPTVVFITTTKESAAVWKRMTDERVVFAEEGTIASSVCGSNQDSHPSSTMLSSLIDDIIVTHTTGNNRSAASSNIASSAHERTVDNNNINTFVILCASQQRSTHLQIVSDSVAIYYHSPLSSSSPSPSQPSDTDRNIHDDFARIFYPMLLFHSNTDDKTDATDKRSYQQRRPYDSSVATTVADEGISITLLFDQSVTNWKEYMYKVQNWIDHRNHQQQDDALLSTLCHIGPLQLIDVFRTDILRSLTTVTTNTVNDTNHHHDHRYLLIPDNKMVDMLSNIVLGGVTGRSSSPNVANAAASRRNQIPQHIILYIPYETTYMNNINATTTYTMTPLYLSIDTDRTTTQPPTTQMKATPTPSSIFGIINHIDTISSLLDRTHNQYFLNCLNVVYDDVLPTDADADASGNTSNTGTGSRNDLNTMMLSFYVKLYYHHIFFIWHASIFDRIASIYDKIVQHQPPHSIHHVYAPWSTVSLMIPIQLKLKELINRELTLIESSSEPAWIYSKDYEETYSHLQQIEESIQTIIDEMNIMKQLATHSSDESGGSSMIIDLDVAKYDIPMEQYLAIFGPLLFPLIIPLLITLLREYVRHRKRRRNQQLVG